MHDRSPTAKARKAEGTAKSRPEENDPGKVENGTAHDGADVRRRNIGVPGSGPHVSHIVARSNVGRGE